MTEAEKPLTREDVLKMIEEHGGPEGLDLKKRNLEGIDLSSPIGSETLDLHGIILESANLQEADLLFANLQKANLLDANLQKANLSGANLQKADLAAAKLQEADLRRANLQKAELSYANLQGADLRRAKVSGTKLYGAKISHETSLQDVEWGTDHILGDEQESQEEKDKDKKREQLRQAESVYRNLKQWHTQAGVYDIAGEFYFREMTVKRKDLQWRPNPIPRAWSKFLALLCGYGEKPLRVVVSAAVVVFGMAGIYTASALTFLSSLYHSAVSFTALGYGLGASNVDGWIKALGAAEAFMGVFMMALFLITFVRKMTR